MPKKPAPPPKKKPGGKPSAKGKGGMVGRVFGWVWRTGLCLWLLSLFFVLVYRWVPVPITQLQLSRCYHQFKEHGELRLRKEWKPLTAISPHLQLAVVCAEDQKFLTHSGFDREAIEKAIEHNKKGKRLRGASTISQQTAKNVFLWEGRSWLRKGLEVYFTVLIELVWGKQRILEVYLNVIEMGDGIYGAQAASKAYFNRDAKDLLPQQAAAIAAILPSPRKYSAAKPGPYVLGRAQWINGQMRSWGGKLKWD